MRNPFRRKSVRNPFAKTQVTIVHTMSPELEKAFDNLQQTLADAYKKQN